LGVAASLEAQGQTEAALQAYQELIRRLPHDVATPQAKFALARLYEAQGRGDDARELYEELARTQAQSSLGNEAVFRLQELRAKQPVAAATPAVTTPPPGWPAAVNTNGP
jgi:TolA-binding protein